MDRREFVVKGLAVPVSSALSASMHAASRKPSRRPNLLFVFSDEHRRCSMPGEKYSEVIAPTFARFAKEGMTMNQCISNYPVCSPYRGILMSGRWPYQSGIIDNALQLPPACGSIGEAFRSAGYETSYVGKWHLSTADKNFIPAGPGRQGFEDWHVWANTNPHFDKSFTFDPNTGTRIQPKGYNATLMTDTALEFVRAHKATDEKPWMMILSWNPPHPPFGDAPAGAKSLYDPANLSMRPNVAMNPAHKVESKERLLQEQRNYYAHISAIDREFERLLKALDETGQAENTIVVYTSDHGEMMGSHGYMGKRLPWEESCNVPFIVRYPGKVPEGKSSDVLFSAIDIFPTMCGLAGVPVPSHCVGQDLSKALIGKRLHKDPESVFLMHIAKEGATGGDKNPAPLFRGIRTNQHTYAVADDGRWMFYDNREDPFQMHNLVADAKAKATMRELDGEMARYLKEAGDNYDYLSKVKSVSVLSKG